jgi:phage antirepressor YoqD-like protein
MQLLSLNQATTMSSRDIAELVDSTHDVVLKTVRRLVAEGIVLSNETPYIHPQNGQTYTEFFLSYRDTLVIASGYNAALRAKIIDRWQELETQQSAFKVPQTYATALLEAGRLATIVDEQALQLQLQAPAVAYVENFVKCDGLIGVREAAKSLGLQQNAFVQMLIGAKIMYRENGHLQSYQSNIDAGRFVVKAVTDAAGKARSSTMLTAKGIRWVAQKLELDKLFGSD